MKEQELDQEGGWMAKEGEEWRKKEEWPLLRNQQEEEDWRRRKMEKGWKHWRWSGGGCGAIFGVSDERD